MYADELLPLLKETAERAELVVRRERGMPTGVAKIKGKITLVLEPGTPPAEECHHYLEALRRLDLSAIFVPPAVREALEGH